MIPRSEQLAYFRSALEECDHKKMKCLKVWNGASSDGRFFITRDLGPINGSTSSSTLKDVFSNKKCRIMIPIIPVIQNEEEYRIELLTHDTGLLAERTDYDDERTFSEFSLSLLELDWFEKKVQKVQTFSFENQQHRFEFQQTLIDSMDPKRFLLQCWHEYDLITLKPGRVHDDKLLFGDDILTMNRNIGYGFCSLAGNTLYAFNPWLYTGFGVARIYVTQLDQDAQTSRIELARLPEKFTAVDGEYYVVGCFAMDRLYLAVQHKKTKRYGIV